MTKIYLAGTSIDEMAEVYAHAKAHDNRTTTRALFSYYYFKKVNLTEQVTKLFARPNGTIFADSGAHSAFTKGVAIDLREYAEWIRAHKQLFAVYANLDVIRNATATWKNQQKLEQEHGLSPLPVFHTSEPWTVLERYLERYSYIALGGGGARPGVLMPWLVKCFKMAEGRAVYHGFGMTDWRMMKSFPWYSVDSSSWNVGGRFGRFLTFDERRGALRQRYVGQYQKCYAEAPIIRALGYDPALFIRRGPESPLYAASISMVSFYRAEQWLQKRWGDVSIPERSSV